MKFAHLRAGSAVTPHLAAVIGRRALFLDTIMPEAPRDLQELIEQGDFRLDSIKSLIDEARANNTPLIPLDELRYASAVLRPPHIIALGTNYAADAAGLALHGGHDATVFSIWPNSLTGHGATTSWAGSLSSQVDYDVALGVIIGKPATDVSAKDALEHVWGYTVINDITARNLQFGEAQWSRCKSFDGFTPCGPVVVTADEVDDPQKLRLRTIADGVVVQDACTSQMIRSVAQIIEYLSKSATLPPGTLIATGSPRGAGYMRTPPSFLKDGSAVTVSIEGIGHLTTHCEVKMEPRTGLGA